MQLAPLDGAAPAKPVTYSGSLFSPWHAIEFFKLAYPHSNTRPDLDERDPDIIHDQLPDS